MKFYLPSVPNEVFDSAESARLSELRSFDLYLDENYQFFFNRDFQDIFYSASTYQNEQAHSRFFYQHLGAVAQSIRSKFGSNSKVVEVGCGKGFFFGLLSEMNFSQIQGFDNAYQGSDPRIFKRYLKESDSPLDADVLVLRHVLEHIKNPIQFLNQLAEINRKPFSFVIEVPSTEWIIANFAFWDFTYEHVNYFTENSFRKIFSRCQIERVFEGQYLLVFGESESLLNPVTNIISKSSLLDDLFKKAFSTSLFEYLSRNQDTRFWLWGGATKGVLVSYHLLNENSSYRFSLQGIIDINPLKQNKFVSGSGIEIISPQLFFQSVENDDVVIVVNPNYEVEIRDTISRGTDKTVQILTLGL